MLNQARIFNGKDNPVVVLLQHNGQNLADYSAITRVTLATDALLMDSAVNPEWFDWQHQQLSLSLGFAGLTPGKHRATLTSFDPDHPNGFVWSDRFYLSVVA